MNRPIVLSLLVCLALTSAGRAGSPTNRFTLTFGRQYLAVQKGELRLGRSTFGSVSDNRDAGDRWYVLGTQIKSSIGGGYLVYDASGNSTEVYLKPRVDEGVEWAISVPGRGRRAEDEKGYIRAGSGPYKGWYLTIGDVEEERDGRKVSVRGLVLSPNPPEKIVVQRIWDHK